jgi:hypothetical protein
MQIFIHGLDSSQSVANIQENETLNAFLLSNNLSGFRLVCQGSILTEDNL